MAEFDSWVAFSRGTLRRSKLRQSRFDSPQDYGSAMVRAFLGDVSEEPSFPRMFPLSPL
jgi:hypothetical protein